MKVTPALKKELAGWLDTYWSTYLKGDIETWAGFIHDEYRNIGGTKEEIWNSKQEIINYTYSILDQMVGTVDIRNRKIELIPYGEYMMVHEFTDLYVKLKGEWVFYGPFRMSSLLEKTGKGWIALHQHGSYPDMKAMEGEAFSIDALKAENEKLQAAVKSRTIELEIETALEKVRAEAMGIKKPDDILAVCKIMFRELHLLGFQELRNTLINFWDDERSSLIDYDYSDETGGHKAILSYSSHPVFEQFQQKIKTAQDAFAELVVTKDELESWKQRRRDSGEYEDPRLNNISALYYYFYSIGVGAIGISTFKSISEDQLNILKRFRNVFDFAYRRYADVAQAEAQAREAEIELALERVRARTMAMQKSEELPEAANLLFQQIQSLGMPAWSAGYCTWNDNKQAVTLWMSTEGALQPPFKAPTTEDELFIQMRLGEKKGETLHIVEMGGDNLAAHYKYMRTLPVVGGILDSVIEAGHPLPTFQIMHYAYFSKGFLLFITYEPVPASHDIFIRFAKVFEQTYTRFLDLQKAEAQAREAKIEAALERTRTQSMLMQHSEQLDDTLRVFHEQVLLLGIHSAFSFLWLPDEQNERHIFWAAWEENNLFKSKAINYPLNRNEPATAQCLIDWRSNEPVYSYAVRPEGVKDYFSAWKELLAGVEKLKPEYFSGGLHYVEAFMKYGCFGVMVETDLDENEKKLLSRFAIEFERTYTRFLDLQKAEAQAKEAKVEAALERVRSKTMAMQHSDDLFEVIHEVNAQLQLLNFRFDSADFLTDYSDKGYKIWVASVKESVPEPFYINAGNSKITMLLKEAIERGNDFFTFSLNREEKNRYFDHVFQTPVAKNASEEAKQFIYNAAGMAVSCFVVKNIILSVANFACIPYKDDENDIIRRFAFVFEQSYTRFLDLQKAEVQAREAQIEAALERVRSRSMAMQKSEELKEVIKLVYKQLIHLKINLDHAGFVVDYKPKGDWTFWIADEQDIPSKITHPYFESVWANQFNEAKEKGTHIFTTHLNFEEKNRFYGELLSYVPGLPEDSRDFYLKCPGLAASTVLLENIGLYIENFSGIPYSDEENATLLRFGKVFQQTYTRFLDLQKAERQVREAQIETALERIRSQATSMQRSTDLLDVVVTMRNEFIRLGHEAHYFWHMLWSPDKYEKAMTSGDGTRIGFVMELPRHIHGDIPLLAEWEKSEVPTVVYSMNVDAALDYVHKMISLGDFKNIDPNAPGDDDIRHIDGLTFIMARTTHGEIGYSLPGEVPDPPAEDLDILVRFAGAFDLAHRRFLDLQKAEEQAQNIRDERDRLEKALHDLQATQKQLIQSEKMASLGELTAGIAHEIQNPLNFVNNFSEVSNELIDEMNAEIEKGDMEEAKAIANDIKQNLEKINHHGKRADAIVKGMLQHSRSSNAVKEPTDINKLADEYLRLAYHGLRAKDKSFNATMKTDFDESIGNINIIPQDIGRVILNLITNAFYVVDEKKKQIGDGYEPTVTVSTSCSPLLGRGVGGEVRISVKDNGSGIPQKVQDKIFQPFFTTKPTGQGTGLGLSLSYDIVKAHGGELRVVTEEGEGSEFVIQLPLA